MKPLHLLATVALIGLAGCTRTNDYTPPADATGEAIFTAACVGCHESKGDHTFELNEEMTDKNAIAKKITEGGTFMPSFPNIQGQALDDLAAYVQLRNKIQ
jgi:cytochrome c551